MEGAKKRSNCVADAVTLFKDGLYCSEAILKSFNNHYHLGLTDTMLRIATGFGAGLGAAKCCCGSITGGVMVLSLVSGRSGAGESEAIVFDAVNELYCAFQEEFKASCCRVLTKSVVWGTPEHHQYCIKYIRRAAELTEILLWKVLQKQMEEEGRTVRRTMPKVPKDQYCCFGRKTIL